LLFQVLNACLALLNASGYRPSAKAMKPAATNLRHVGFIPLQRSTLLSKLSGSPGSVREL
jgi:hypothetical protein